MNEKNESAVQSRDGLESDGPLPHSRVGIAAFVVSLIAILVPGHLMALIAIGAHLSPSYVITFQWTAAALAVTGVVLAVVALFDERRNRFLGMCGWWLGIIALSTLALSIRLALRHHVF